MLTGLMDELIATVCEAGPGPGWVLNVSCGGFAVSVAFCACAVSKEHSSAMDGSAAHTKNLLIVFTACSKILS